MPLMKAMVSLILSIAGELSGSFGNTFCSMVYTTAWTGKDQVLVSHYLFLIPYMDNHPEIYSSTVDCRTPNQNLHNLFSKDLPVALELGYLKRKLQDHCTIKGSLYSVDWTGLDYWDDLYENGY